MNKKLLNVRAGSLLRFMLVLLYCLNNAAQATDINCENTDKKKYEELICDYSILNSQYDEISKQQESLLSTGRISEEVINAWRERRNSCHDVKCMDTVFAEWADFSTSASNQVGTPRPATSTGNPYTPLSLPVRSPTTQPEETAQKSDLDNADTRTTTTGTTAELSKETSLNNGSIETVPTDKASEQPSPNLDSDGETHWVRNIVLFFIAVMIWKSFLSHRRKSALKDKLKALEGAKEAHRIELLSKYHDENIVDKILRKVPWIGQTKQQLLDSLLEPEDIDVKAYKTKTQETWKYGQTGKNRFALRVTLDDDIVVSYDDKR